MVTDVELVARWYRAYNAREVDGLCAVAHTHIELVPSRYFAPPGTSYHGHAGVRSLATHTFENFPAAHAELKRTETVGEWTLADVEVTYDAGSEPRATAFIFRFEDGLIRRIHAFSTAAEAVEAAGKPPEIEFRALFDDDPGPIVLMDEAQRLADVNPAACNLFGLGRTALIGRAIADFVTEDCLDEWRRCLDALGTYGHASGRVAVTPHEGPLQIVSFWASAHYAPGRGLALLRVSQRYGDGNGRASVLTPREREILQLLARGLNAPQVADDLFISPLTVRTHVQNAMNRLGANTRVQAIALALARGEIEP